MKVALVLLALRPARAAAAGDDELENFARRLAAKTRADVERSVRGAERIAAPAGAGGGFLSRRRRLIFGTSHVGVISTAHYDADDTKCETPLRYEVKFPHIFTNGECKSFTFKAADQSKIDTDAATDDWSLLDGWFSDDQEDGVTYSTTGSCSSPTSFSSHVYEGDSCSAIWSGDETWEVTDGECTPTYEPAGGRRRLDDCIATAVAASECPPNAQYMANCDDASIGELCEGDGECGTDTNLDNCGSGYDVYRRADPCDADGGRVFSDEDEDDAPTGDISGYTKAGCDAIPAGDVSATATLYHNTGTCDESPDDPKSYQLILGKSCDAEGGYASEIRCDAENGLHVAMWYGDKCTGDPTMEFTIFDTNDCMKQSDMVTCGSKDVSMQITCGCAAGVCGDADAAAARAPLVAIGIAFLFAALGAP